MKQQAITSGFHTLFVQLQDEPGSLDRVISMLRRRQFAWHSIAAGPSSTPGVMQVTLILKAEEEKARLVQANLNKIASVIKVESLSPVDYTDLWHLWAQNRQAIAS